MGGAWERRARIGALTALAMASTALSGPALGADTTYVYDANGRLVSTTTPEGIRTTYGYDQAGNIICKKGGGAGGGALWGTVSWGQFTWGAAGGGVCPAANGVSNPIANPDGYTTAYGIAKTFNPTINDLDPNGYALAVTTASGASHGTPTVNSGASVTYTPFSGFSGIDTFDYAITNGHGGTATAKVTMMVGAQAPNRPPTAGDDHVTAPYNTAIPINVLQNDGDLDGDPLTITSATTPGHGSRTISGSTITYTPASGFAGTDSFSYSISDGRGGTASANVIVDIGPSVQNDHFDVAYNSTYNSLDPKTNDVGVTAITSVGAASHGTAWKMTLPDGTNQVGYTPTTGFFGDDSFTYTATNGVGSATATITVTVAAPGGPTANADVWNIYAQGFYDPQTMLTWYLASGCFDPRTNDTSPAGYGLTVTAANIASRGQTSYSSTQVCYNNPSWVTAGYQDSFSYNISDGHGGTAQGQITVNVVTQ